MAQGRGVDEVLSTLLEGQRAFWSAALDKPAFETADAFAEADWQAFDAVLNQLLGCTLPDAPAEKMRRATNAAAAYREVISGAWSRVRAGFEAHRNAIRDPRAPAQDWRLLRDRWFQIAGAEFILTERSQAFLDAQREVIRASIDLWSDVPEPARQLIREQRRGLQTAVRTADALGVDGVPIAETPRDIVWESGRTTLSRYRPLGSERRLGPVLIAHGLIGRQTMTDLRPERSLVRNLLVAGVDLFVIDWGDAGPEDSEHGLDYFVGDRLGDTIEQCLDASGTARLVLFGICQGGTLAACHAARFPDRLNGLITAVAPFDFHADVYDADPAHGLLNVWVRSLEADDVDSLIGMEGNLSGVLLGAVFNQLNPLRTLAKYVIEMPAAALDPSESRVFLAMEKWLADRPDLPGNIAKAWLNDLYRDNALIKGGVEIKGEPVRLDDISVPVLNIFATGDHIIPAPCSRALGMSLAGKDYEELALPTGHIGAFVSTRSQTLLAPRINAWLERIGARCGTS